MATQNGQLLIHRMRVTIPADAADFDVDTGVTQVFKGMDPDPGLNIDGLAPPSRVQVIPQAPIPNWDTITHGEPYFDSTTQTVHVEFSNSDADNAVEIVVLIWNPHTSVCPISCDTYNPVP